MTNTAYDGQNVNYEEIREKIKVLVDEGLVDNKAKLKEQLEIHFKGIKLVHNGRPTPVGYVAIAVFEDEYQLKTKGYREIWRYGRQYGEFQVKIFKDGWWKCPKCTMINPPQHYHCKVCDLKYSEWKKEAKSSKINGINNLLLAIEQDENKEDDDENKEDDDGNNHDQHKPLQKLRRGKRKNKK